MLYCDKCKINISTLTDRCPLCHRSLPAKASTAIPQANIYGPSVKRRSFSIAGSAVAIILAALSVIMSLFAWIGTLWCTIFSAGVLYLWFLGRLSFNKRITIGKKMIAHAAAVTLLLFAINLFANDSKTVNTALWAVSYGAPIIFASFIMIAGVVMLIWKQYVRDLLFYQFGFCIICLVPLVLVLCGLAQPLLPSLISAGSALLIAMVVVFAARQTIKAEMIRKFHL